MTWNARLHSLLSRSPNSVGPSCAGGKDDSDAVEWQLKFSFIGEINGARGVTGLSDSSKRRERAKEEYEDMLHLVGG